MRNTVWSWGLPGNQVDYPPSVSHFLQKIHKPGNSAQVLLLTLCDPRSCPTNMSLLSTPKSTLMHEENIHPPHRKVAVGQQIHGCLFLTGLKTNFSSSGQTWVWEYVWKVLQFITVKRFIDFDIETRTNAIFVCQAEFMKAPGRSTTTAAVLDQHV